MHAWEPRIELLHGVQVVRVIASNLVKLLASPMDVATPATDAYAIICNILMICITERK